ncbi:MAG: hypothetical protein IT324_30425 [Anaerolineae bacterium]|nr:hypothetical protein [Anaerolineae bacterium]
MNKQTFIATTRRGLVHATPTAQGRWAVDSVCAGQQVCCLAADPHHRDCIYAGTRGNGVLHSGDGGKTWQPSGMAGQVVKAIAASPVQPGLIFAGTKPPGVFVSRDGGQSWTELESFRRMRRWFWFTPAEPGDPYVQAIALSPTDSDVIVAGVECGAVLRSVDGGKTWQGHLRGAIRDCHCLTFHATDGNWVYEAGGNGAAFSRDGGATWQQPDPPSLFALIRLTFGGGVSPSRGGLDRIYGVAVGADPARPEVWYISASPGPFKAHGAGNAEAFIYRKSADSPWEKLNGGLPQPLPHMPYALLPDRAAPGHLYAALSNGDVWHTTDYGDCWQKFPFNLGQIGLAVIML